MKATFARMVATKVIEATALRTEAVLTARHAYATADTHARNAREWSGRLSAVRPDNYRLRREVAQAAGLTDSQAAAVISATYRHVMDPTMDWGADL